MSQNARVFDLDKNKDNAQYKELLEKLDDIPTLPAIAMKVNDLINDPNSSVSDITDVLKKDQVLTAKILRLANSSYYAIPGGVNDVQRALAYLGYNTLAQIVLGLSVMSVFPNFEGEDFSMMEFWKHALGVAVAAQNIAKHQGLEKPEEAFTCGLLHDIGKLVMHEIDPKRLFEVVKKAKKGSKSFLEVENEWDLPGHSFMGFVICEKWGLPQLIGRTVRYHHTDVSEMDTFLPSEKKMIQIVRFANQLCVRDQIGNSGDYSKGELTSQMLSQLSISTAELEKITKQMEEDLERAEEFLNVSG